MTDTTDLSSLADAAYVLRDVCNADAWITTPGVLPDSLRVSLSALVDADDVEDFVDASYALRDVAAELLVPGVLPETLRVALTAVVTA